MIKLLNIWFIIFCIWGQAQDYTPVTELSFPNQVPYNTTFDISLITDNSVIDADKIRLYIFSRNNFEINTILLRTDDVSFQSYFARASLPGVSDRTFLSEIDLKNNDVSIQSFFQILINFSHINSEKARIRFYGEFIKDEKVITTIGSLNGVNGLRKGNLAAEITSYKPGKVTRNAAKFEGISSELSIELSSFTDKRLWIGFWIKVSGGDLNIFRLMDKNINKSTLNFGLNRSQIIFLQKENGDIINTAAPFYSRRTWMHIGMDINISDQLISFFRDGMLFGSYSLSGNQQISDFILTFSGESSVPFTIEQLRIIKPKSEADKIVNDSKYISVSTIAGETLLQLNFDSVNELSNAKNARFIKSKGLKFVISDAPVFSRAPELDISIMSTYNFLEWKSSDVNNASHFIIEKSLANNGFFEIGTIAVTSDLTDKFSYIDASRITDEIVYYRIKQINKDGSSVYSAQVKVGMGNIEQFKLNQNYPNPFNPLTSIEIDLFEDSEIEVIIYNLEGQELALLHKGFLAKCIHKFEFDASNLPSGVYLYKVSSPVFSQTKKMLLTK